MNQDEIPRLSEDFPTVFREELRSVRLRRLRQEEEAIQAVEDPQELAKKARTAARAARRSAREAQAAKQRAAERALTAAEQARKAAEAAVIVVPAAWESVRAKAAEASRAAQEAVQAAQRAEWLATVEADSMQWAVASSRHSSWSEQEKAAALVAGATPEPSLTAQHVGEAASENGFEKLSAEDRVTRLSSAGTLADEAQQKWREARKRMRDEIVKKPEPSLPKLSAIPHQAIERALHPAPGQAPRTLQDTKSEADQASQQAEEAALRAHQAAEALVASEPAIAASGSETYAEARTKTRECRAAAAWLVSSARAARQAREKAWQTYEAAERAVEHHRAAHDGEQNAWEKVKPTTRAEDPRPAAHPESEDKHAEHRRWRIDFLGEWTALLTNIRQAALDAIRQAARAAELAAETRELAAIVSDGRADASENGTQASPERDSSPPPSRVDADMMHKQALHMDLAGLAFSGGGIRSATFALGVLQALAKLRLVGCFDYLSTVSGGGYIGSWLAAWVWREKSLANVEVQIASSRVDNARATRTVQAPETTTGQPAWHPIVQVVDEEPEPVHHLRAYSRYLAPRTGWFSTDTWSVITIYLRNLLMNLLVIVPATLAVVLAGRLLVWLFTRDAETQPRDSRLWWLFAAGAAISLARGGSAAIRHWMRRGRIRWPAASLLIAAIAAAGIWLSLREWFSLTCGICILWVLWAIYQERTRVHETTASPGGGRARPEPDRPQLRRRFSAPLVVMLITGLWALSLNPAQGQPGLRHAFYEWLNVTTPLHYLTDLGEVGSFIKFVVLFGAAILVFSFVATMIRSLWGVAVGAPPTIGSVLSLLWCDVILGLLIGAAVFLVLDLVVWKLAPHPAAVVTLGVPLLLLALVVAGYGEMALVGGLLDEYEREWRSRLGAHLLMIAAAWLVFFGATLYVPWILHYLSRDWAAIKPVAAAIWAAISAGAAWAGRSPKVAVGNGTSGLLLKGLAAVGPPVFLLGLLAAVSLLAAQLPVPASSDLLTDAEQSSEAAFDRWGFWLIVSADLALLFLLVINVNRFSMHMFYANRLIRCYLGASRRKSAWGGRVAGPIGVGQHQRWRWLPGSGGAPTQADAEGARTPSRPTFSLTGFDPHDDLALSELRANLGYGGPYLLVNTALNLVAGDELAYQDRKAEAFVLTPDYCGSRVTGYARTPQPPPADGPGDLSLGRAMTISGAAVDPNMGMLQSPPLTALMTIFNTRLGWWMQNPRQFGPRWRAASPLFGDLLWHELFGRTDEKGDFIHLSDGGHFENLGVYELIRRRCRFIIVTDADSDRHAATDNLANLLRLVRTDFGIRIDIDTAQLERDAGNRSTWHCAIGLIRYDDVDEEAVAGILVYLQASLTGDEGPDIRQYADHSPTFPHETTLDQFFSEAQFESYRGLGYHVAQTVFSEAVNSWDRASESPGRLFALVRRQWFPPPPKVDLNFSNIGEQAVAMERSLGRRPALRAFSLGLYPEMMVASESANLHAVNELLQVIELAWYGVDLENYHAHPLNLGWMNTFRRWTSAPKFHEYWPILRAEYSQGFVRFCERALNLISPDVVPLRLPLGLGGFSQVLAALDEEFYREWGEELDQLEQRGWRKARDYLTTIAQSSDGFAHHLGLQGPLFWLLYLPGMKIPCGLVCAGPWYWSSQGQDDLEFLVWLRGPYRNLGIGRNVLPTLLDVITDELALNARASRSRLRACYPDGGDRFAERLEKSLWMNFFFDHGFRSRRRRDPDIPRGVIVLSLDLLG